MRRPYWVGVLFVLLAGCVSTGDSTLGDDQAMGNIKVGETTKQQVVNLLGDPEGQRSIETGGATREWWSYSYASAVINPLDYLLLYGFLYNGLGLFDTRYDLSLFFDHRGIVSGISRSKTDYDMGRPFMSIDVSSSSHKAMGFPDATKRVLQFEDKMDYRY